MLLTDVIFSQQTECALHFLDYAYPCINDNTIQLQIFMVDFFMILCKLHKNHQKISLQHS